MTLRRPGTFHTIWCSLANRVVFNCSFSYQGHNLNELLLPGPTLSPSLLAVLLRFREHSVAISSDIRGMFHQVRLLPCKVLKAELTLPLSNVTLWSDSTTVLTWLLSASCRFKVFVGTRVAEIQELTESDTWRYVQLTDNPADAITRGKSLSDLTKDSRWNQGPAFLKQTPASWTNMPQLAPLAQDNEQKKATFCGLLTSAPPLLDPYQFHTFQDYLKAIVQFSTESSLPTATAEDYKKAELTALPQIQVESFPDEVLHLESGKPLPSNSRLLCLAPELDSNTHLIRVGGRLRQISPLEEDNIHPIMLNPQHPLTKLMIV